MLIEKERSQFSIILPLPPSIKLNVTCNKQKVPYYCQLRFQSVLFMTFFLSIHRENCLESSGKCTYLFFVTSKTPQYFLQLVYVFHVILRLNVDYFFTQPSEVVLCNEEKLCSV